MRLAYNFNLSQTYPVLLIVLWVLGLCMICMAALVWLPIRVLGLERRRHRAAQLFDSLTAAQVGGPRDVEPDPSTRRVRASRPAIRRGLPARAVGGGHGPRLFMRSARTPSTARSGGDISRCAGRRPSARSWSFAR